ncbi:MAG: hypothetical protein ACXAEX_23225 [Promethearchaeota archaeon]|jgi:hypothetical protein
MSISHTLEKKPETKSEPKHEHETEFVKKMSNEQKIITHQTQLPKPDEPINCAFQRRYNLPFNQILCGITTREDQTDVFTSDLVTRYDPCLIDICPMFQAWKILMERGESLKML